MFKLMGNKRLLIVMLLFIMIIALMGLTYGQREKLTWPEKLIKDSVSWVQGLIYKPARAVAGLFDEIQSLHTIYEENKVLKSTLSHYAMDTARLNDLKSQNVRLKEMLEFTERQKQSNNYKFRVAEVIAVSPDAYNSTKAINLGAKDGIKPNMAVMSVDGLVGRITTVSEFYSNIQVLEDINETENTSKAISATVLGKEDSSFGIIVSYDRVEGMLAMTKILKTDKIAVGDTVITSGLGQIFPRGIAVGKVVSIKEDEFGITQKAMVKPLASFGHLREVFVVEVPEPK